VSTLRFFGDARLAFVGADQVPALALANLALNRDNRASAVPTGKGPGRFRALFLDFANS